LVVAYALAGKVDIDFDSDPVGTGADGKEIYLSDLWPSGQEISEVLGRSLTPAMFRQQYGNVYSGNETWNEIPGSDSELYAWDPGSTYIQEPPFFEELSPELQPIRDIEKARVLVKVGDSITTDHISPAGAIASATPAGKYLIENGVSLRDFNSYGSRRGNDRIVTRGAFANVRLRNQMAPGTEGGWTTFLPTAEVMSIYDASLKYQDSGTPLVVLAGNAYGTGSSRDQAAKGTLWLGVKFVIAESYERIHRSNLIGMGVLPLQFMDGQSANSLGLDGTEFFSTVGLNDELKPGQEVTIQVENADGSINRFQTVCRIDTPVEVEYYQNGGILQTVLRDFLTS
jgi:aconitate hydratase